MTNIRVPKKLIEVALPLDDINVAAAREKSIRHGHPSTLHLWWARRPLAAARAVLFAQMVNDPGYERSLGRGINKEKASKERERLFCIIRDLVKWENTTDEELMGKAHEEILKSWRETCSLNKDHPQSAELFNPEKIPCIYDPFAGGGTIPFEAQRLGVESWASDLNPIAVMINKAMIEIPPKFAGRNPIGPKPNEEESTFLNEKWKGARGLAEDVRRYGLWMRNEAYKRIGDLYPQIEITRDMAADRPDLKTLIGRKFTVIAWIWARTIKSPSPAYSHVHVPLATTFMLSTKNGKEAYIEPIIKDGEYAFSVKVGSPTNLEAVKAGTKTGRANFRCIMSDAPIVGNYIKSEGKAGRLGARLMAIVVDGDRGRLYLPPILKHEEIARSVAVGWTPDVTISGSTQYLGVKPYGMEKFSQLFTNRQLVALTAFSDLVKETIDKVKEDAISNGFENNNIGLDKGGVGAKAYAEAIGVYLAFLVDQQSNQLSISCGWNNINQQMIITFSMQAIQMRWDYAECNIFSSSTGSFLNLLERQVKGIATLAPNLVNGHAIQADAASQAVFSSRIISTDPPYYDNVPYADLSDFFYVWLRRSLRDVFPELFATISTPKDGELVAFAYRHQDGKSGAEAFFLDGMTKVMRRIFEQAHPAFPITVYYAFKQAESDENEGTASTGWETFLEATIQSGFAITGTWPIKTESANKLKADKNALASSIVLVCRKRLTDAISISRREFVRELNAILPEALIDMTCGGEHSPVAPVDLSQAIIGPGMAVFSKYAAVLEADGKPMTVRTALQLINRFLAEDDFDHDTQFCLHWFETVGWSEGKFGEADVLARAKGTSVDGVKEAGVVYAGSGKVRLLKWNEYPVDWNPENDFRLPVWEGLHHLIRALRTGGETAAAGILGKLGTRIEAIRQLAYRLYTLCERNGWAEDARAYNELIATWQAIEAVAPKTAEKQMDLF